MKSTTNLSDDEQQPLKSKFAQIKAKFEQKNVSNVMALPSISSTTTGSSYPASSMRQNSRKEIDDLYARHRRASNESIPNYQEKKPLTISSNHSSFGTQNSYHRSQSMGSEKSKLSSFRRFNSADEADEEVSRIHRQGEELRRHSQHGVSPISSATNQHPQQSHVQYEVVDEDGNPMVLNGVQDLIKMAGVSAREVPQPDGTVVKEYVIDDPQLLSQFRSQQQMPTTSSYIQSQHIDQDAPPPPPRVPLRPPMLFRHRGSSVNENLLNNIQQIHVLEPQRRYEYLTTTGRRVQFCITNSDGQSISDADIRELANAINLRSIPTRTPSMSVASSPQPPPPQQQQQQQGSFNLPKQWHPSVDLTHRQRLGSDTQPQANNSNIVFQQQQSQPDLYRSVSSGALNQGSYLPQNQQQSPPHQPTNQWNTYRHRDSYNAHQQNNETFQSSAQFLPQQQMSKVTHSSPIYHQQSSTYPYQGQQQHGVRILHDFNQQRTAIDTHGHPRA